MLNSKSLGNLRLAPQNAWPSRVRRRVRQGLAVIALLGLPAWLLADDYRLGAGDLLHISAFGYPDLTADARVSQSGSIIYPLIGEVPVAGLSTQQAAAALSQRLTDGGFIPKAQMSLLVTEYQSQMVSVVGQVAKPGQYPQTRATRLLDVLAGAGGPLSNTAGDAAAGDTVTILRQDGSKVDVDLAALFAGDVTQNAPVMAGDTVYVPKVPMFYIYGEVQRPGMYRLERGMTVSRAISAGGGLTPRGTERRTVIKRRDASGQEVELKELTPAEMIRPNDVVRVRQSWF